MGFQGTKPLYPPFFLNYRKQLSFIGNIITKLVEVMEFQLSYFKS